MKLKTNNHELFQLNSDEFIYFQIITILYDLIVYRYPNETAEKIVNVQKRRFEWVKKECETVLCISEATRQDAIQILGIDEKKLKVVYPGM